MPCQVSGQAVATKSWELAQASESARSGCAHAFAAAAGPRSRAKAQSASLKNREVGRPMNRFSVASDHLAVPQAFRNAGRRRNANLGRNLGDMQAPADARRSVEVEGGGKHSRPCRSIVAAASHWSAHPFYPTWLGSCRQVHSLATRDGWNEQCVAGGNTLCTADQRRSEVWLAGRTGYTSFRSVLIAILQNIRRTSTLRFS
jgi:hypothetical protein